MGSIAEERRLALRRVSTLPPCGGDVTAGDRGGDNGPGTHRFTSHVVMRSPVSESFESFSWIP